MEPKQSIHKTIYFTPAIGWGILILYFSTLPKVEVPGLLHSLNDKLIHASIYFIASTLIYLGFSRFKLDGSVMRSPLLIATLLSVAFGGAIELIQMYFVPGRSGEWLDFLANTTGSMVFALMLVVRHRALA